MYKDSFVKDNIYISFAALLFINVNKLICYY